MEEADSSVNSWTGKPFTKKYYDILKQRKKLPVYDFKDEFLKKIKKNQVVVVEGETGSGTY